MSDERPSAVASATDGYGLGGALPEVATLPVGTNLLVSGPAMSGKTDLAVALLDRGLALGEHAIVVTPDESARRLRSRFGTTGGLHVVDCSGSDSAFGDVDFVKFVSSPGDLTGIGVGIAKCTRSIGGDARQGVRLAVLSLSTVLRYTDLDALFNFVHVLTGRIEAAGYLGVFTIDPTLHEPQAVNTIKAQMDGNVEVRTTEDGDREVRIVGFPDASGTWVPV